MNQAYPNSLCSCLRPEIDSAHYNTLNRHVLSPQIRLNRTVFSNTIFKFILNLSGVEAVTFRASVVDFACESAAARPAFHSLLVGSDDLILAIIAQQKIGAGRFSEFHRIESPLRDIIRHQTGVAGTVNHSIQLIVPVQYNSLFSFVEKTPMAVDRGAASLFRNLSSGSDSTE
jgi:hypothetical protein